MHLHPTRRLGRYLPLLGLILIASAACQQQNVTPAAETIVVWADPQDETSTGQSILDANDDPERFVLIEANSRVVFSNGDVCNDCTTDLDTATIDLGGDQFIDIRFGRGPDGAGTRRPFLVDAASGNFIQLVGSDPVTFQVTAEPFEADNDDSDDRAVFAGTQAVSGGSSASQAASPLCGILGGGSIGLFLLTLLALTYTRSVRPRLSGD
ncbi:MAG: hypothetical protein ACE5GE_00570 [Phycisphaerae bacterium]